MPAAAPEVEEANGSMAKKKDQKTTPVRLTDEAIKWARIASGYTGESMTEYVSRITVAKSREDAERLHAELYGESLPKPRPDHGPKGKGRG